MIKHLVKSIKEHPMPGYHVFTQDIRAKHLIIKDYKVAAYPTTTLIDKNGRIFLATLSDIPDELIKQIEAALKN